MCLRHTKADFFAEKQKQICFEEVSFSGSYSPITSDIQSVGEMSIACQTMFKISICNQASS